MQDNPREGNPRLPLRDIAFEHSNRTYRARAGDSGAARGWWWFEVTGDGHRYAPFPVDAADTEPIVRARIIAYYEDLVARRERRATWHAPSTLIPPARRSGAHDAFG